MTVPEAVPPRGQRVESFRITAGYEGGERYALYQGNCIGHKKICQLQDPFAEQNPLIDDSDRTVRTLRIHITAARDEVMLKEIKVY